MCVLTDMPGQDCPELAPGGVAELYIANYSDWNKATVTKNAPTHATHPYAITDIVMAYGKFFKIPFKPLTGGETGSLPGLAGTGSAYHDTGISFSIARHHSDMVRLLNELAGGTFVAIARSKSLNDLGNENFTAVIGGTNGLILRSDGTGATMGVAEADYSGYTFSLRGAEPIVYREIYPYNAKTIAEILTAITS